MEDNQNKLNTNSENKHEHEDKVKVLNTEEIKTCGGEHNHESCTTHSINNNQTIPMTSPIEVFMLGDETHPISSDDEVIEYIGSRIRALENLENCTALRKLLLRRNVIKKIENISHLTELEELELYDNQIKVIEGLETLKKLKTLDLSYNLIKKVEGLDELENLEVLFIVENRLKKVKLILIFR
jgi:Leucine-rich repeat (LRR) protein